MTVQELRVDYNRETLHLQSFTLGEDHKKVKVENTF